MPARKTVIKFMPNPIPTILAPNNGDVILAVNLAKGFPQVTAKIIPEITAIPGA